MESVYSGGTPFFFRCTVLGSRSSTPHPKSDFDKTDSPQLDQENPWPRLVKKKIIIISARELHCFRRFGVKAAPPFRNKQRKKCPKIATSVVAEIGKKTSNCLQNSNGTRKDSATSSVEEHPINRKVVQYFVPQSDHGLLAEKG